MKTIKDELREYGLVLDNYDLVELALTHVTYGYEKKLEEDNERLEFLGDSVLSLIFSKFLFEKEQKFSEGVMSQMRSFMVSKETLSEVALSLNLQEYIKLGKCEINTGGKYKQSILADATEALIAAIYLEKGFEETAKFLLKFLEPIFDMNLHSSFKDVKTRLQELVQEKYRSQVEYKVLGDYGPDHNKNFTIGLYFKGDLIASANGKSKKAAQRNCAQIAYKYFLENEDK